MNKIYTTTKADFEKFKAECRKWVKLFGLMDWEWEFKHEYMEEIRANVTIQRLAKRANVALSTKIDIIHKTEISKSAFHEVCHVLLDALAEMAEYYFNAEEVTRRQHEIIQVLTNVIYHKEKS